MVRAAEVPVNARVQVERVKERSRAAEAAVHVLAEEVGVPAEGARAAEVAVQV